MVAVLSDVNRGEVREEGSLLIEAVSLLVERQRETESWIAEQIWQAEERAAAAERLYAELADRLAGIEEHLARLVQDVEPLRDDAAVDARLERLREQVEGLKSSGEARTLRPAPVSGPIAFAADDLLAAGPEPAQGAARPASGGQAAAESPAATPGRTAALSQLASARQPAAAPHDVLSGHTAVGGQGAAGGHETASSQWTSSGRGAAGGYEGASGRVAGSDQRAGAGQGASSDRAGGFWVLFGETPRDRFGLVLMGVGLVAVAYAGLTQLRF